MRVFHPPRVACIDFGEEEERERKRERITMQKYLERKEFRARASQ
jgi:hypothetical protein